MPHPSRRPAAALFAAFILLLTAACQGDRPPPVVFRPPPKPPRTADRVIVFKNRRLLELQRGRKVLATFPIALGPHPRGRKEQEGDGRTPEGDYIVDWRSADTRYDRELHISYPNARDIARARRLHVDPGGAIFIHGLPLSYGNYSPARFYKDWTEGCIAVGNVAINKIWDAVPNGTPVVIRP